MQLVLMVTARCNASCSHCSTSCGPHRTECLPRETIERLIREAVDLSKRKTLQISITGGEPFLDLELLKHIIHYGHSRGAVMSCVSNGYWASSPEKAVETLQALKDRGLALLAISTSRFHQQFVSRKRVNRALDAARRIGLECVLKVVRTSRDGTVASIRKSGQACGAARTEVITLMPTVREERAIADAEYIRDPGLPTGTCPGAILNIAENGRAYPCCTPGAINEFFALGDISEVGLQELQSRFYLGAKQQVLRTHGPAYFANAVRERGLQARLRSGYANVCDLCTHIASDPQMATAAEAAARAFVEAQVRSLLTHIPVSPAVNLE